MRILLFSRTGRLETELVEKQFGPIEWTLTGGSWSLTVDYESLDYDADEAYWAIQRLKGRLVSVEWAEDGEPGAGLPPWAGVITLPSGGRGGVAMTLDACPWLTQRVGTLATLETSGTPGQVLQQVFAQMPGDGYPFRPGRIAGGGRKLSGPQPAQSLYSLLTGPIAGEQGWEWTVRPVFDEPRGRLWLEVDLAPRIGRDLGYSRGLMGGVDLVDSSVSVDGHDWVNRIVGMGTAGAGDPRRVRPVVQDNIEADDEGAVTDWVQYSEAYRLADVAKLVEADLERRSEAPPQCFATVTDAFMGPETNRLMRLGQGLVIDDPRMPSHVTIDGFGYSRSEDRLSPHLRGGGDGEGRVRG